MKPICVLLAAALWSASALADEPAHAGGLAERDALTGDWGGGRGALEDAGFRLGVNLTSEVFADAAGGARRTALTENLMEAVLDADLQKAFGWDGALVHVNGYLTAGRGLSAHALGNNLLTASNIEADRGGRLFDLWLQQTFLKGAASVRIGQVAAAEEFFVSRTAALFLNGTYGWPAVMSSDLPGGGPTYPLATPGARVAYAATAALSFSAGIFNGDPSGPGPGSALARNPSGTRFRLNDGAFVIAEAAYRPGAGEDSYKFGAWYHSKTFADPAYDTAGRSLAALSAGPPRSHHGDYGLYALADKVLWTGGDHALSGFIRAAAAPGDRNLIAPYADAGLTYKGVAGAEDMVGLAVAYAGIGANARRFDRDLASFDPNQPIRDFEGDLEFTYQTALTPWLILQPDVQIILHPGGAARPVPSALTLGLRSVVVF